ncbi:WhiB family transcriptional regulator [Streptomyces sp. NPDC088847]|uniref:WhiB family transcriptional regulator n=1 Tax=Streptomyces sp. NPDC088847 TaxID=3365909 RepID=UPI0038156E3C
MHRAACIRSDPEIWFPDAEAGKDAAYAAASICFNECPVRLECLRRACRLKDDYGIFAGLGPGLRREYEYDYDRLVRVGNRYRKSLKSPK